MRKLDADKRSFLEVCLPYCIERMPNGKWVCLNRYYKPIGFELTETIKYMDYPVGQDAPKAFINAALRNLEETRDGTMFHFYTESNHPLDSKRNMDKYMERLKVMAALKVRK